MKRNVFLIVLLFFFFKGISQITYEKGYYINNAGFKTDGLIKNLDWKDNPSEIMFKTSENAEPQLVTIEIIQKFVITGVSEYVRETVQIDKSSEVIENMSYHKYPKYVEETLLLKTLVQGKANLFVYENSKIKKFFFNVNEGEVKQLFYKSYLAEQTGIAHNNMFQQQLLLNLKCNNINTSYVKKIGYQEDDLKSVFIAYNKCMNSDYIVTDETEKKKNLFNFSLRAGVANSSLSINNGVSRNLINDLGSKLGLRLGAEMEFVLPFNKNKWAIIAEPIYKKYKADAKTGVTNIFTNSIDEEKVSIDYTNIQIAFGGRYYFFLSEKSRIFINAGYTISLKRNEEIEFNYRSNLKIEPDKNFYGGLGFKQNKLSIEFRYNTPFDNMSRYWSWESEFKSSSLILGYTVF